MADRGRINNTDAQGKLSNLASGLAAGGVVLGAAKAALIHGLQAEACEVDFFYETVIGCRARLLRCRKPLEAFLEHVPAVAARVVGECDRGGVGGLRVGDATERR